MVRVNRASCPVTCASRQSQRRTAYRVVGVAAICLAALLAACGGDSATAPGGTTTTKTDTFHLQPPNPVAVTATPDAARSATMLMSATAGGTLEVTAANGTTLQLVILPGALADDTQITMTPLSSLTGLPFDATLVGAVQLGPEGLTLLKPAQLTIVPGAAVPPDRQVTFGYHGTGAEFHLEPPEPAIDRITLDIAHFSGAGLVNASQSAAEQAAAAHEPTSGWDQYMQAIGAVLQAERTNQLLGKQPDPTLDAQMAALIAGLYRDVVLPAVQAAANSDEAFQLGLQYGFAFMRMQQLLGGSADSPEAKAITLALQTALNAAVDRSNTACTTGHDLSRFTQLVGYARMVALLTGDQARIDDILKKAFDCMHFELEFNSEMYNTPSNTDYREHALVPLAYALPQGFTGSAAMQVVSYTQSLFLDLGGGQTCTFTGIGGLDDVFNVVGGAVDLTAKTSDAVHPTVTLDPGHPKDITHSVCTGLNAPGPSDDVGDWWRFYWNGSHGLELLPNVTDFELGPWVIEQWTNTGPGVWRKEYHKAELGTTCGGIISCGAAETTTLVLRHVPKTS
jgi:hypothetical protein